MKKSLVYFLILAGLLAVAYYLINQDDNRKEIRAENYDFAVADTAAVDRIVMKSKKPEEVVLERMGDHWMVNGKYNARGSAITTLLETLHGQEMKNYIPEAQKNNVYKNLSASGTEVMVYSGDDLIRHFYVGGNAPDMLGTYMMNFGASDAYVVHKPGHNGFLNTRYFTEEHLWRSKSFIRLKKDDIASVSLQYNDNMKQSFEIQKTEDGYQLTDLNTNEVLPVKEDAAEGFFEAFSSVLYEGIVQETDRVWPKVDSIKSTIPAFELRIQTTSDSIIKVDGFHKIAQEGETDNQGNLLPYDRDRKYAIIPSGEFVLIQNYAWKDIFRPKDYFRAE
jgi:hypothetical protein